MTTDPSRRPRPRLDAARAALDEASNAAPGEVVEPLSRARALLDAALDEIQRDGGVVVYLRGHEGRGIGLINKLRAYRLQEDGFDTLDANVALGLPADARDYGAASAILQEMGIEDVRLLTNNPEKVRQLEAHGVEVTERVPLVVGVNDVNAGYLETKREKLGHTIGRRLHHQDERYGSDEH